MLMPFGKYKGEYVENLPESYIVWLWENVQLREPLKSEIVRVLATGWEIEAPEPGMDKVKSVYRELSFKYHPDRGGNHLAQCAVNEFYERLMEV